VSPTQQLNLFAGTVYSLFQAEHLQQRFSQHQFLVREVGMLELLRDLRGLQEKDFVESIEKAIIGTATVIASYDLIQWRVHGVFLLQTYLKENHRTCPLIGRLAEQTRLGRPLSIRKLPQKERLTSIDSIDLT
jgi:hypothetical protein